ncbi:MAG: hypothetical protein A3H91_12710 [Gammaproteobacteria bacterium RIFCSPLOWO2_02_FULL_61_13]|nr:MAG: hypothetical protein A3H91_12710 [Gammaproteobacteria bacterium RIFCSPLOWO2_02_FULL_61_13]
MKLTHHAFLWLLLAPPPAPPAEPGPVSEFEQVVADRLAERGVPGEMIWLQAEGRQFLGLYLGPPPGMPKQAVILLHGLGGHPDWPDVIQPLRARLPSLGWGTLSIQLPRLSPQASHADEMELPRRVWPRIHAAIAYLAAQGVEKVVLAGYGFGAALSARYAGVFGKDLAGFVAISLQTPAYLAPRIVFPESLEAIKVPVLDVYAAEDAGTVLQQAPERELWGRKNKERVFDRIVIAGARPDYHGQEAELARQVADWLSANAK